MHGGCEKKGIVRIHQSKSANCTKPPSWLFQEFPAISRTGWNVLLTQWNPQPARFMNVVLPECCVEFKTSAEQHIITVVACGRRAMNRPVLLVRRLSFSETKKVVNLKEWRAISGGSVHWRPNAFFLKHSLLGKEKLDDLAKLFAENYMHIHNIASETRTISLPFIKIRAYVKKQVILGYCRNSRSHKTLLVRARTKL